MLAGQPSDEALYREWCADPFGPEGARAWNELYSRHYESLVLYCETLTHDRATAEDCAEEALIRMMRQRDIADSFRAYLWKAARNLMMDSHRRDVANGPVSPRTGVCDASTLFAVAEEHAALWRCLRELEPKARELVLLRVCDGLTFQEAKKVTGLSRAISTLKSMYDKALRALRRCLEKS